MVNLTWISKIPGIKGLMLSCIIRDIKKGFAEGNTVTVFFADQYLLNDPQMIRKHVLRRYPEWQLSLLSINYATGEFHIIFAAQSFQALYDGIALYKNALKTEWVAFFVAKHLAELRMRAKVIGFDLQTDEAQP